MGNRPDAMLLLTRDNKTQKNRTQIYASSKIRTHDPSVRAVEDSRCLTPRGHLERFFFFFFAKGNILETISLSSREPEMKLHLKSTTLGGKRTHWALDFIQRLVYHVRA
jgi:hypothetical protein